MKITSKPGNGNKVHVYLDGKYDFTLYDDFWYRLKIAEGSEITDDELAPLKEEAGFRLAYEKGVMHLSRRAYGEKELYRKLLMKYGAQSSQRAVDKLKMQGYINDEEFALDYAKHLFDNKHFDTRRVIQELRQKGIDGDLAAKTAKSLDNQPIERIIVLLKSKYSGKLSDEKERQKLFNRFLRMGYTQHDIREAFSVFSDGGGDYGEEYFEE